MFDFLLKRRIRKQSASWGYPTYGKLRRLWNNLYIDMDGNTYCLNKKGDLAYIVVDGYPFLPNTVR